MNAIISIADIVMEEMEKADPYMVAFVYGRRARIAGVPRDSNPHISAADHGIARLANSWDAGWVFGKRG